MLLLCVAAVLFAGKDPFLVKFLDGSRVRLTGVCDASQKHFWQPDGSHEGESSLSKGYWTFAPKGKPLLLIEVTSPHGPKDIHYFPEVVVKGDGNGFIQQVGPETTWQATRVVPPTRNKVGDIHMQIATAKWKSVARCRYRNGVRIGGTALRRRIEDRDFFNKQSSPAHLANIELNIPANPKLRYQCVAFDANGNRLENSGSEQWQGRTKYFFVGKVNDVREIRLQERPLTEFTFKRVHLRPN